MAEAGNEVTGKVVYPDGQPVSTGKIHVLQKDSNSTRDYVSTTALNEAGEYRLLLPSGEYELQASALYHVASATQSLALDTTKKLVDFELSRPVFGPGPFFSRLLKSAQKKTNACGPTIQKTIAKSRPSESY